MQPVITSDSHHLFRLFHLSVHLTLLYTQYSQLCVNITYAIKRMYLQQTSTPNHVCAIRGMGISG